MNLGLDISKVGVLALHSHTAEESCDETCSVYDRREVSTDVATAG